MAGILPGVKHRLQSGHDAFLPDLEEITIASDRLKELHDDSLGGVQGDTRRDERIDHLAMAG